MNANGAERGIYRLLTENDVDGALALMQDRDSEVDNAIQEYNPQTHAVMRRRDKDRYGQDPYISEKLPRTRQRYINEVELFFLLGTPIKWRKDSGDDDTYRLFTEFLRGIRFDSKIRQAKRLAGAETESAIVFRLYNEGGEVRHDCFVASRSLGYRLRPMFDQYGNLSAFCYGYTLLQGNKEVQHWDFQTADGLFYCTRDETGWQVEMYQNPTGKINAVYFRQPKAWDGVEARIHREEMLDSKIADTNNYFADPIAAASADVITNMIERAEDTPGKMINLIGSESRFEYINPPQSSETRRDEMAALEQSILFDTFTPDLSFDNLKGFGSVSGVAVKNAMTLGYIKRANRMEIYGEMIDRLRSVVLSIIKLQHPNAKTGELAISFDFQDPFASDNMAEKTSLASLYQSGVLSLRQAVSHIGLAEHTEEEVALIKEGKQTEQKPEQEE